MVSFLIFELNCPAIANLYSSIVFSAWVKTLDIVASVLNKEGLQFCRIHGKLREADRRNVLKRFQTDYSVPVLLMTLGTGAVG
jgi:SNF2 family DNA or RNA helicase